MRITALTCSTGRPECLKLCRQYVARQTRKVDEHLVIEGGTFLENMREGLKRVPLDQEGMVIFFEDDDWYPDSWVQLMVGMPQWHRARLVGQAKLHNYHVPSGGYESVYPKRNNCPMHATAIHTSLLPDLRLMLTRLTDHRIDVALWNMVSEHDKARWAGIGSKSVISMKGMPGTPGFSQAHKREHYTTFDTDRSVLRQWIGDDVELYRPYFT